jgi:hypothetical protein
MIDFSYSLIIEATDDPNFFGFYSPDLEGFTGIGNSVEDCLYKARWGMEEYRLASRARDGGASGVQRPQGNDPKLQARPGMSCSTPDYARTRP